MSLNLPREYQSEIAVRYFTILPSSSVEQIKSVPKAKIISLSFVFICSNIFFSFTVHYLERFFDFQRTLLTIIYIKLTDYIENAPLESVAIIHHRP